MVKSVIMMAALSGAFPNTNSKGEHFRTYKVVKEFSCEELNKLVQQKFEITNKIGCNSHGCAFALKGSSEESPKVLILSPDTTEALSKAVGVTLYECGHCVQADGTSIYITTNFENSDA